MPYTFTQGEKNDLRRNYRENVGYMNTFIPDPNAKIKLDFASIDKRLNDPREAWLYKKALEVRSIELAKKRIQEALTERLGHLRDPNKAYELDRTIHTELIPSTDPEAMAYNEEVMRQYFLHPEAMLQRRYQNMLNADLSDLTKIAKSEDPESLMLLYAEKNPTLVEDSATMASAFENPKLKPLLTPEMKQYSGSVLRNFEPIFDVASLTRKIDQGYFTVPHTYTAAQENYLDAVGSLEEQDKPLYDVMKNNVALAMTHPAQVASFVKYFKSLEKSDVKLDQPGALSKFVVYPKDPDSQPTSLSNWINNGVGENPFLAELPKATVNGIKQIFATDYTKEEGFKMPEMPERFKEPAWKRSRDELVFRYAVSQKRPVHEIDNNLSEIAAAYKGGTVERMFNTTSHEYKNLLTTMKDYDNPDHVGYHDDTPVRIAANQYLIHKGVKTREEAMRLTGVARDRALLCFDLIDTFQKNNGPEVSKIVPGTNQVIPGEVQVQRVQAIANPQDVEFDEDALLPPQEPGPQIENNVDMSDNAHEFDDPFK